MGNTSNGPLNGVGMNGHSKLIGPMSGGPGGGMNRSNTASTKSSQPPSKQSSM